MSYVPLILSYAALSVFTAVNPNEVQYHPSLIYSVLKLMPNLTYKISYDAPAVGRPAVWYQSWWACLNRAGAHAPGLHRFCDC